MSHVYLAGPMSGIKDWNFPAFHDAANKIRTLGHQVTNPAEHFDGRTDLYYDEYIEQAMKAIRKCDTIVLLPKWEMSEGAAVELKAATQRLFDVFELEEFLRVQGGIEV